MQISIAGYSFHGLVNQGCMNVYTYLETCRYRYQLRTADLWCGLLGSDPNVYLTDENIAKVKTALNERELELVNYHADGCHVWEDDPAKRAAHLELAEKHIAAGEKLGAKTIRIDSGGKERHWTDEQFDVIANQYKVWARRAAEKGYRIGPETHWGTIGHADNQLRLAREVNMPSYGILLHMGKLLELPLDEFDRQLAPFAMHTHIDQRNTETRLSAALQILTDAGYTGAIGVEHHSAENEYAEVAVQLAHVIRAMAHAESARSAKGVVANPPPGK